MKNLLAILAAVSIVTLGTSGLAPQALANDEPTLMVAASAGDIVDIAVADGRFTTLVTAVQAAGLVDTLKSDGPFTVFAPTDAAFALLPAGTVEGLLGDVPALTAVLLYHVVAGSVMASDVVQLSSAATVGGSTLSISTDMGGVMVNTAHVVITDIIATNGIIHVIDAVLLPPM